MMSMLASWACLAPAAASTVTVKTPLGNVHGSFDAKTGVSSFKGIRYALAPTGANRFANPEPWTQTYAAEGLQADSFGSRCVSAAQAGSEDCLFMNIYTPVSQPSLADPMPILFFIHGGAFIHGAGSDHDGTNLAAKHHAVVVTVNYRLGSFGWALLADGMGNFGLKDQREGLRFLQRSGYISAFGGDIARLMVFGSSAGAIAVVMHMVAPRSFGMFTSALFESGFPHARTNNISLAQGSAFSRAAGCDQSANRITCLISKTTEELKDAESITSPPNSNVFATLGWGPTIDNDEFAEDPKLLFAQGRHANVPVVGGSNTNEGDAFVYPSYHKGMDSDAYKLFVRAFLSNGRVFNETLYDMALQFYPPGADNRATASRLVADGTFVCGAKLVVQHSSQSFLYHFAYHGSRPAVYHGAEIPFVFDSVSSKFGRRSLAETMGELWVSFAKTGRPGSGNVWPRYSTATDRNIVFDIAGSRPSLTVETGRRLKFCNMWLQAGVGA
ncbi:unnamed protein product [Prorocentrum cordatum]|uniref:Carboxylic ester hydrolase n=1 Tax=Prorocentrum cordatum TaxID=2364126 RepID=A0ABN9S503_9DINO|nr:unnamed protein product [Polarella glacialis]